MKYNKKIKYTTQNQFNIRLDIFEEKIYLKISQKKPRMQLREKKGGRKYKRET